MRFVVQWDFDGTSMVYNKKFVIVGKHQYDHILNVAYTEILHKTRTFFWIITSDLWGHAVVSLLRHCATSQKVAGWRPNEVIGFYQFTISFVLH
jgi:hypothetical protein